MPHLPIWEDCRNILKSLDDVPWDRIVSELIGKSAFQNDNERLVLYEIIIEKLQQ